MKKIFFLLAVQLIAIEVSFAQNVTTASDRTKIKNTITGFLDWYKLDTQVKDHDYWFSKGGYPDTTTKIRIDFVGVDKYLDHFKKTGFVSDTYTHSLKEYFVWLDGSMAQMAKTDGLVKINGFDIDFVLLTYEPEAILDHIKQSRITKFYLISKKALVELHISKYIDLVFVLTKTNDKWLIDDISHDVSDKNSLFLQ